MTHKTRAVLQTNLDADVLLWSSLRRWDVNMLVINGPDTSA